MPGEVSAVSVPTGIPLNIGLRFQPRTFTVIGHHPIRLELEQVLRIQVLRLFERSAGQAYRRNRQRASDIGNGIFDLLGTDGADNNECGDRKFYAQTSDLSQRHGELLEIESW